MELSRNKLPPGFCIVVENYGHINYREEIATLRVYDAAVSERVNAKVIYC